MSQKLIFYPLGNAETILFEMNNGEKILFDFAAMKTDAADDKRYDIKEELSDIDEFRVVMFTHAHDDHTRGASDFFYFDHAKKYQSIDRKKIKELWVSSAFLLDTNLENGADAKIIRNEARFRLKNNLGIKIFAAPESLTDWLEQNDIDYDSVKEKIVYAGTLFKINSSQDNIEFFVHAPFSEDSEDIDDKNNPSIVVQMRCINDEEITRILITGDVPYNVLDKIVEKSRHFKNEEYLLWDIYDIPHHCSHTGLNKKTDKDGYRIEPTENIKWLLHQSMKNANMIASCDEITEETSPPHLIAKRSYEFYTAGDVKFLATMEHHAFKKTKAEPIEFIIDSGGIELLSINSSDYNYMNTEQFIENRFRFIKLYSLKIDCKIKQKGRKTYSLRRHPKKIIPRGKQLEFNIVYTDCPEPYDVLWKVKNNGIESLRRDCVRGVLENPDGINNEKFENADFQGHHYVECYLVKDGICVAKDRIEVHISRILLK